MSLWFSPLLLAFLLCCTVSGCVTGSGVGAPASGTRSGLWYTPSRVATINGLAVGLESSSFLRDTAGNSLHQTVNGISVELLGAGIIVPLGLLAPFGPFTPDLFDTVEAQRMLKRYRAEVNGVSLAVTGPLGLGTVNGVTLSPFNCWINRVNGLSAHLLINDVVSLNGLGLGGFNLSWKAHGAQVGVGNGTHVMHGLQAGVLFNTSDYLHGMQIGLINLSHTTRGAQIGLYNSGGNLKGVQVGLINRAGRGLTGLQLGLLNIGPPGIWPLLSVSL